MGLAVDTSALVDLERSETASSDWAAELGSDLFVPALVVAELWVGIETARSRRLRETRQAKIAALLRTMTVLPFVEEVAPTYARLFVQQRRIGKPVPFSDLAIAATAIHHGHEILVGRSDESHFRAIRGLTVRILGPTD